MSKNKGLDIKIINGQLVISIGINTLAHSVMSQEHWPEGYRIVNPDGFAEEMMGELDDNDEGNFIGFLLDRAALSVFDKGSENIEN